jgi:hypothetical protein
MFVPKIAEEDLVERQVKELQRVKEQEIVEFLKRKFLFFYPFLLFEKDYQIMINEVKCNDPTCVPIETLVIIFLNDSTYIKDYFQPPHRSSEKILKPLIEVTEDDLNNLEIPFQFLDQEFYQSITSIRTNVLNVLNSSKGNEPKQNEKKLFLQQMTKNYNNEKELDNLLRENNSQLKLQEMEFKRKEDEDRKRRIEEAKNEITVVKMKSSSGSFTAGTSAAVPISNPTPKTVLPPLSSSSMMMMGVNPPSLSNDRKPRHEKDGRMRGCPCCDPDNLDNKIDKMMFLDIPPN